MPFSLPSDTEQRAELLYTPNGQSLEFISFGYRNVLSDVLWFNAIGYFGKHFRSDQDYRWLYHMADIVTTLNPRATHVFEFASTMLSWEAGRPDQAVSLLGKAIKLNPDNWLYYYLRGFTNIFFLHKAEEAKEDFVAASRLPDAHPLVARLAAKSIATLTTPEAAIDFLKGTLSTTKDPDARKALEEKLKEAYLQIDLNLLTQALEIFRKSFGREPGELSELIAARIVLRLPLDPFGGQYYLDATTGRVRTTSNHKGISSFSKNGDTENGN